MKEEIMNSPFYQDAKLALNGKAETPKQLVSKDEYESGVRVATCQIHGEFEVESQSIGSLTFIKSTCQKCSDIYATAVEQKVNELKEKSEREKLLNRLKSAGISDRHLSKTFDNFETDTKEKKFALESMRYFADKVLEGECKNVILCGSVGTGKTHLCHATVRHIIESTDHFRVQIATITEVIRFYRSSWAKDSKYTESEVVEKLSTDKLLVIDEMGVQVGSDNELNIIFEIINNRYENKLPTVIISNLEKGELVELLGQRIIDRLKEDGCRVLGMSWDSHRETNKEEF